MILFALQAIHFQYFFFRLVFLPLFDLIHKAITKVVFHKSIFNARKSLLYRRSLGNNIYTIFLGFDHFPNTPHLPLNDFEPPDHLTFNIFPHNPSIYPLGVSVKQTVDKLKRSPTFYFVGLLYFFYKTLNSSKDEIIIHSY